MNWNNHGKSNKERTAAKGSSAKVKAAFRATAKKPVFPLSAKLKYIAKSDAVEYIMKRCKKCDGKTVGNCLGMLYKDTNGNDRTYGVSDLKYDIAAARLKVTRA